MDNNSDDSNWKREKGPTATKRYFKTQLNAFFIWMLCNITTSTLSAFQRMSLKEGNKEEKNVANLVLLTQKQETRSTYLTL